MATSSVDMADIDVETTGNGRAQRGPDDHTELWNIFRKDRLPEKSECCVGFADTFFRVFKIVFYIFLLVVVIGGVVVTRGGLQILASLLGDHDRRFPNRTVTQDFISYLFFFLIAVPDALKFLQGIGQFLFGSRESPSCVRFLMVVVREVLHLFGLGCLLFKVMPYLDPLQACIVTLSVPVIPSIVNMVSYCYRKACQFKKGLKKCFNFASCLFVLATIVVLIITIAGSNDGKNSKREPGKGELVAWVVVSVALLSSRWIETYSFLCRRFIEDRADRRVQDKGHALSHLCSSLLRLILLIVLFPTLFCPDIRGINETYDMFMSLTNVSGLVPVNCTGIWNVSDEKMNSTLLCLNEGVPYWLVIGPYLAHTIGAFLTTHFGVLACRLRMQVIGFALPLSIGTPLYFILIIALNEAGEDFSNGHLLLKSDYKWLLLAFFCIGWLGQLWVCRHAWFKSRQERLEIAQQLFVLPHYCSPMVDLALLHSRKKLNRSEKEHQLKETDTDTKVYICATMWHENRVEMKQILISIFRLDHHQFQYEYSRNVLKHEEKDYYTFEAHIPFDDAMETNKSTNKRGPNDFVRQFMEIVDESASAFYQRKTVLDPPKKYVTPYGGRLEWELPGENKLVVHLKDKDKIRHKKRWSQIMYMYYFVGYELMVKETDPTIPNPNFDDVPSIFQVLSDKVKQKAENTYVLALDGDVDFQPEALQLLIDRMKINPKVGATCGRIKPGGSGPVVWYQRFEYAIGHWLQKSAEHMFGCVLCSPGCFSLFRVKALMDDNVMRTYATLPTEARHFLQYDQGEDRWLCTLMLQQGYKIEYCAAAEAITFAPEEFKEFFNQRRRWMPSTMANIMDLLQSYARTTKVNPNISYFYIFYQIILFVSSVLGPSTVLLALESAVASVFGVTSVWAYLLTYGPTILFIVVCLKAKTDTQLTWAMILSAVYALLMMAVFVGTLVSIASEGWYTPTGMFFYILVGTFVIAGFLHPHEFGDLLWGVLYFICIPAGYLFLIIYAICNLNNISWGTRENKSAVLEHAGQDRKKSKKKETEDEIDFVTNEMISGMIKQVKNSNITGASCSEAFFSIFRWINNLVILKSLESVQNIFEKSKDEADPVVPDQVIGKKSLLKSRRIKVPASDQKSLDDKSWATENVVNSKVSVLNPSEERFWKGLIHHYLYPLDADKKKEERDKEMLAELRDKVAFAFFFLNALWLAIMTAMNEVKHIINIKITQPSGSPINIEPLGFVFLVVFTILLLLQFIGMLMHRHETLLHILSITKLSKRKTPDIKQEIGVLAKSPVNDDSSSVSAYDEENPIYSSEDMIKSAAQERRHATDDRRYAKRKNNRLNLRQTVRRNLSTHCTLNRGRGGVRNTDFSIQE